jgi:hypothetical protein
VKHPRPERALEHAPLESEVVDQERHDQRLQARHAERVPHARADDAQVCAVRSDAPDDAGLVVDALVVPLRADVDPYRSARPLRDRGREPGAGVPRVRLLEGQDERARLAVPAGLVDACAAAGECERDREHGREHRPSNAYFPGSFHVTLCAPVPSAFMTKNAQRGFDGICWKAIRRPSGDQESGASTPFVCVSLRMPVPSAFAR